MVRAAERRLWRAFLVGAFVSALSLCAAATVLPVIGSTPGEPAPDELIAAADLASAVDAFPAENGGDKITLWEEGDRLSVEKSAHSRARRWTALSGRARRRGLLDRTAREGVNWRSATRPGCHVLDASCDAVSRSPRNANHEQILRI